MSTSKVEFHSVRRDLTGTVERPLPSGERSESVSE